MRNLMVVTVAAFLFSTTAASAVMTEAECEAAWIKADANNDGAVTEVEAARYHAALRIADKKLIDGKLSRVDFLTHCKTGLFDATARPVDLGAPLAGANSFTETQAHDRAVAAGFSSVSALKKDDNGIWRGSGSREGKSVNVAIDYKGNVVEIPAK